MLCILICDDDDQFTRLLQNRIEGLPDYDEHSMQIVCIREPDALTQDMMRRADIIFMDVALGGTDGLALSREIRSVRRDSVLILVTNYGEYAAEGYEVNAFRFLPKLRLDEKLPSYFRQALAECHGRTQVLHVLSNGESIPVRLDDLVYAETEGRFLLLHLHSASDTPLKVRMPLRTLEEELREQGFLRIHNSYLVNLRFVTSMQTKGAVLTTGTILPLSLHNYRAVKLRYLEWKGRSAWNTR